MKVHIYHNPRCQKSRNALAWLQNRALNVEVRLYMEHPLSLQELEDLQRALQLPVSEWLRSTEPEFQTLISGKNLSDEQLLEILALHPKLMQRPIVECHGRAVVARDLGVLESFNFE
jgi:arsenate reductase